MLYEVITGHGLFAAGCPTCIGLAGDADVLAVLDLVDGDLGIGAVAVLITVEVAGDAGEVGRGIQRVSQGLPAA